MLRNLLMVLGMSVYIIYEFQPSYQLVHYYLHRTCEFFCFCFCLILYFLFNFVCIVFNLVGYEINKIIGK
jgi:hypothetical protein